MQNFEGRWIKFHVKIEEWEWFTDANTYRIFTYLMIKASTAERLWQGTLIPSGGLITSVEKLSKTLMISAQSIRTSLNKLKSTNDLTIKTTKQFTLIQLNNWDKYQATNEQTNKRLTNDQQTTNNSIRSKNIRIKNSDTESSFQESSHAKEPTPRDEARQFFEDGDRRQPVIDWLVESKGVDVTVASKELEKFVLYWTEPTQNGKRQRWEMEKAFEIRRRLATWLSRASQASKPNYQTKPSQQWHVAQ